MKRHQVVLITSARGLTWAACQTCGRKSKQRASKAFAEAWQAEHVAESMRKP